MVETSSQQDHIRRISWVTHEGGLLMTQLLDTNQFLAGVMVIESMESDISLQSTLTAHTQSMTRTDFLNVFNPPMSSLVNHEKRTQSRICQCKHWGLRDDVSATRAAVATELNPTCRALVVAASAPLFIFSPPVFLILLAFFSTLYIFFSRMHFPLRPYPRSFFFSLSFVPLVSCSSHSRRVPFYFCLSKMSSWFSLAPTGGRSLVWPSRHRLLPDTEQKISPSVSLFCAYEKCTTIGKQKVIEMTIKRPTTSKESDENLGIKKKIKRRIKNFNTSPARLTKRTKNPPRGQSLEKQNRKN